MLIRELINPYSQARTSGYSPQRRGASPPSFLLEKVRHAIRSNCRQKLYKNLHDVIKLITFTESNAGKGTTNNPVRFHSRDVSIGANSSCKARVSIIRSRESRFRYVCVREMSETRKNHRREESRVEPRERTRSEGQAGGRGSR